MFYLKLVNSAIKCYRQLSSVITSDVRKLSGLVFILVANWNRLLYVGDMSYKFMLKRKKPSLKQFSGRFEPINGCIRLIACYIFILQATLIITQIKVDSYRWCFQILSFGALLRQNQKLIASAVLLVLFEGKYIYILCRSDNKLKSSSI